MKHVALFVVMAVFLAGCKASKTVIPYTVPESRAYIGGTIDRPLPLQGNISEASEVTLSTLAGPEIKTAIRTYQINKGQKPGPYTGIAADLDSDGNAEAIVYLSGKGWCARTGCTMAVFTKAGRGYKPVSTVRRVKLPIVISRKSHNYWRDLIVRTGLAGREQTVALEFGHNGYPGNAVVLSPYPKEITIEGDTAISESAQSGDANE
jgi:hypothetical protein